METILISYLDIADRPKNSVMFMYDMIIDTRMNYLTLRSAMVPIFAFVMMFFHCAKKTHLQVCGENPEHVSPHCKQGCPSSTSVMRTP